MIGEETRKGFAVQRNCLALRRQNSNDSILIGRRESAFGETDAGSAFVVACLDIQRSYAHGPHIG